MRQLGDASGREIVRICREHHLPPANAKQCHGGASRDTLYETPFFRAKGFFVAIASSRDAFLGGLVSIF